MYVNMADPVQLCGVSGGYVCSHILSRDLMKEFLLLIISCLDQGSSTKPRSWNQNYVYHPKKIADKVGSASAESQRITGKYFHRSILNRSKQMLGNNLLVKTVNFP